MRRVFWSANVVVAVSAFAGFAVSSAHAGITYTSWHLSAGFVGTNTAIFTQVPSPFVNSPAATNGISSASAQYNITYDNLSADIQATTQLSLQGGPNQNDFCFGRLRFFTDQPVLITVNSFFTYAMPSGDRTAQLSVSVTQKQPVRVVFQRRRGVLSCFR